MHYTHFGNGCALLVIRIINKHHLLIFYVCVCNIVLCGRSVRYTISCVSTQRAIPYLFKRKYCNVSLNEFKLIKVTQVQKIKIIFFSHEYFGFCTCICTCGHGSRNANQSNSQIKQQNKIFILRQNNIN